MIAILSYKICVYYAAIGVPGYLLMSPFSSMGIITLALGSCTSVWVSSAPFFYLVACFIIGITTPSAPTAVRSSPILGLPE